MISEAIKQQVEYGKCAKSPAYYLNNYGYVFNAIEQKITRMQCYDYQIDSINKFHKNRNSIILKSRQCLPENTFVDTPDGPKAIQDLKKGDSVYSYNLQREEIEIDTVTDFWCSGEVDCVKIYLENGKISESGKNHPFYVVGKGWILAQDLLRGDQILDTESNNSIVTKIEDSGFKICYDISVEKNENFLINGLVVHNTGLSVITAGYVAWRLLFRYDEKILIIANDGAGAVRFLSLVRQFLDYTPLWLQPTKRVVDNQKRIQFSNNSYAEAKASSPDAGRGDSLTLLVLDETAFIEHAQDIWMAAGMALSKTRGKCIMISTPCGTGSLYHRTWVDAVKKDNDFVASTVHWTQNPDCKVGLEWRVDDQGKSVPWSPWYEEQCRRLNWDSVKIAQELDLSFEGSQYLALESKLVAKYENLVREKHPYCYFHFDFDEKGRPDKPNIDAGQFVTRETKFHIWKKPEKGRKYILSADIARGDGQDYSTIQILDVASLEQVGEYQGRVAPDLFAYMIYSVGMIYNEAYLVIEANSFGLGTCFDLRNKMGYRRMFISKAVKDIHVRPYDYKVDQDTEIPGFQTSKVTRPLVVKCLQEHLREGELILNSPRVVNEFKTFIMKANGKAEHDTGYNDDLIFALAIGLYIRDTEYNNVLASKETFKAMLDAISFSSQGMEGKRNITSKDEQVNKKEDLPEGGSGLFFNSNSSDSEDDNDVSWLMG